MSDAPFGLRGGPRPTRRRGLVALLAVAALVTCTEHSTGPAHGGRGSVAIRPILSAPSSVASFGLTIDSLRVRVTRPVDVTVLDTTVFFDPNAATLQLALSVQLIATVESLAVHLELLAGSRVLFAGTDTLAVSVGAPDTTASADVSLTYVGPGAGVTSIRITPRDSVVTVGGTKQFSLTADSAGVPVDSVYVNWSTSDTALAPINGAGVLQAPNARGSVLVRAVTPNNRRDSTRVTFVPVPVAVAVAAGGGQTAVVGTRLPQPLRARVTAADLQGVKGVAVRFVAPPGASVRDSVVITDSAGFAEDTATLGTVAGSQSFQAIVIGLTPATFSATATAGSISAATSVVTVSGPTVASGATATLTLQAKDAFGNNLTSGGAIVVFTAAGGTSTGTIGPTTDNGTGMYTATFRGGTAGTATTIGATIDGTAVTSSPLPTITVTAGAISPATSIVTTSSGTVTSGASATLTLQARDSAGNAVPTGGATIVFTRSGGTSTGTIGPTTDQNNGSYTATFVAGSAGTPTTIGATVNGVATVSTTTITVVPGNTVAAQSVITVSADTIASGGTSIVTLQARDSAGNDITTGGLTVVFSRSGGTSTGTIAPSPATDNNNGTYTATFTGVLAGTATTIGGTIDGAPVTSTLPSITVTPGAISAATSLVSVSDSVVPNGGIDTLFLLAKDAAGNSLTTGGATVVFTQGGGTSAGTIGATTDLADGKYRAIFTATTAGTPTTIGATIGGVAVTTPLPTIRVFSTVTTHSTDVTADETWAAAQSPHIVTGYLRVRNGARLTIQTGALVRFDAGAGLQVGDTALNQAGGLTLDGTGPGITLTANTGTPVPGFWRGIEVQRSLTGSPWRRVLFEWAGGARPNPFNEACILLVNASGAAQDLDSLHIRRCVHAGIHHFGGTAHVHRSVIDSVTGSGIHADFAAVLELDSTTIRGSGQEGLFFGTPGGRLLPSSANRIVGNGNVGIDLHAAQLPGLLRQDSIAGNGSDVIEVTGGPPDPSVPAFTIFDQPQPPAGNGYRIKNGLLDIGRVGGQAVTLDSNLVLRFDAQTGLVIGDSAGTRSGTIGSLGTTRGNAPRLTSSRPAPAPGDWYGLEIGRLSANARLANVRIEFAGDSIPGRSRHRFGLLLRNPALQTLAVDSVIVAQSGRFGSDTNTAGFGVLGAGAGVDIRRSVAEANLGYGFVVAGVPNVKFVGDTARANTIGFGIFTDSGGAGSFTAADSVANNVATGNTFYPLSLEIERLPVLYGNAFTGNGRDTLLLEGGRVTFNDTLPRFAGLPWRVQRLITIDSGGVLTIAPGDTLAFDSLAGIVVGDQAPAALAADGSTARILLTASSAFPQGWFGIEWRKMQGSGSTTSNVFRHVDVDRAGFFVPCFGDCSPIPFGALRFTDSIAPTNVNLSIDNIIVRRSNAIALDFQRGGTGTVSILSSQFYDNNPDPMIRARNDYGSQLFISGSDLYHYRGQVIESVFGSGTTQDTVRAPNNWWGDVAGVDTGFTFQDSLGRASTIKNAVLTAPFATTPFFPVGTAAALVATQDTLIGSPPLSSSDSVRVRVVDGFGRGVPGPSVSWTTIPSGQSSVSPSLAPTDLGGRADVLWQFTNSAGQQVAQATAVGAPVRYVADVQPGLSVAVSWALDAARSQGTVTGPKAITFTSTNRRGVVVTHSSDQFGNATHIFSSCFVEPGLGCPFVFPPYGAIDSVHTSGGVDGDTIFFHANVTQPSPFVLRALYNTALGQVQDSVLITMAAVPARVVIDRDEFTFGVQIAPDTFVFNSLCPAGQPNVFCQREFHAFVVDSGLAPFGNQNALFQWSLLPPTGAPVSFTTRGAPANDSALVTALSNGFVRFVVQDNSPNNFGADTLPILVQQLPYVVQVDPDSQSVAVGGTGTFTAAVVDEGGDTIPSVAVHWRNDNTFNPHLTIVDTSVASQVTVRLDSTPLGSEYVTAFALRGPSDTVYGFGSVNNPLVLRLAVGNQPWAIAANSQTHAVYVGHQGGQLYRVNGTTDTVTDSAAPGLTIAAVAVNAITNRVYAATDQGVAVLDGGSLAPIAAVPAGTNQQGVTNRQGLTVDSINNRIYVTADIGSAAPLPVLRRIDGTNNTLVAGGDVPLPDVGTGAAFNPVNGLVYVAIPDSNLVVAVDPIALAIVKRITLGRQPFAVAVNPVTNRVYVIDQIFTPQFPFNLYVIDATAGAVAATLPTSYQLGSVAVDVGNNRIYVGAKVNSFLLVFDGATDSFASLLNVGTGFFDQELGVAVDAGNGHVYTANYSSVSISRLKF